MWASSQSIRRSNERENESGRRRTKKGGSDEKDSGKRPKEFPYGTERKTLASFREERMGADEDEELADSGDGDEERKRKKKKPRMSTGGASSSRRETSPGLSKKAKAKGKSHMLRLPGAGF